MLLEKNKNLELCLEEKKTAAAAERTAFKVWRTSKLSIAPGERERERDILSLWALSKQIHQL